MSRPELTRVVTEMGRALGWMGDNALLCSMAENGWDPVAFRLGSGGLDITFELTNASGTSVWTYDCNQEGGGMGTDIDFIVSTLNGYMNTKRLECIFCYRTGLSGAERNGPYVRFFGRRLVRPTETSVVRWDHRAVATIRRARATLPGGWTHVATINSHPGDARKFGIYKRMMPREVSAVH